MTTITNANAPLYPLKIRDAGTGDIQGLQFSFIINHHLDFFLQVDVNKPSSTVTASITKYLVIFVLALFEPIYNTHMYNRKTGHIKKLKLSPDGVPRGVVRHLDATGCLGLVLFWYQTRGSCARVISIAFGLTSSCLYRWIQLGRRVLLFALQEEPSAKVSAPTADKIEDYVATIGAKYHIMGEEKVWGAADGLKIKLQASSHYIKQSHNFNGYTHGTYVNLVYVFAPDGQIY